MKKTILTTLSVIALMGALPVLAEMSSPQTVMEPETTTLGIFGNAKPPSEADIKQDMTQPYDVIRATLIGKQSKDKNMPIAIEIRNTANGIIGHQVYNAAHESLAKVTDIILDKDSRENMVIVSDGTFGMGKKVAFNYSDVTGVNKDGDVFMSVTEDIIKNSAPFSYDNKSEYGGKMRVIPIDGYSVNRLLKARLLDQNKESVADIENISFNNGTAEHLLVGFDKTLGFGGEQAVIHYTDATIVRNGNALDFQLSTNKAAQFAAYKKDLKK